MGDVKAGSSAAPHDVRRVVKLNSSISGGCDHCGRHVDSIEDLAGAINHYIQEHGYALLHVGEETTHSAQTSGLWHSTIAVLGAVDPPAVRPPPKVIFKE